MALLAILTACTPLSLEGIDFEGCGPESALVDPILTAAYSNAYQLAYGIERTGRPLVFRSCTEATIVYEQFEEMEFGSTAYVLFEPGSNEVLGVRAF